MKYFILASGSKGNATIIKGPQTKILIDMGLSLVEFRKRLKLVNLDEKKICATLYTHSHTDHLTANYQHLTANNIYAPPGVLPRGATYNEVANYEPFFINELKITALPTSHDAPNSVGYIIETENSKLVLMTDTGYISKTNLRLMANADIYIIEANHNVRLLLATSRPFALKQRILGDNGHLSNEESAHYIAEIIGLNTKEVILAHLSEEANTPEHALKAFNEVFAKYRVRSDIVVRVATQHTPIKGGINEH
ncbi:MAG TPA: MBL fold metallo-hydrolase [Bacilli bacterium]|nr:MBL fold metallo-hydrolase [Bacilli bacterium]